jgi:hypothetical protein
MTRATTRLVLTLNVLTIFSLNTEIIWEISGQMG